LLTCHFAGKREDKIGSYKAAMHPPVKMQRMKRSSLAEGACNDDPKWVASPLSTSQRADICMHAGKVAIIDEEDDGGVEGTRSMCRELSRMLQWHEFSAGPIKQGGMHFGVRDTMSTFHISGTTMPP
jgi:hypothetical protein